MLVYEYLKKKLFLHKHIEAIELTETDMLDLFKEEISNEISVNLKNNQKEDN